ncbi:MAG: hypothetical protein IKM18_02445, partial [Clostridia bacterium]|nr:hypothetical protein [Clostridia bacterium]
MKNTLTRKVLSFFMAALMVFGVASTGLIVVAQENDNTINYVSLGASNVNGYGMHGYLDEAVYEYPLLKETANIYGYKQDTPGSYPVLLKEFLEENGYDVNLSQLAISSMRAEEVRFLLDDSYKGDAYTDWRFCDVEGVIRYEKDGVTPKGNQGSQNWFYLAGALEWKAQGNEGDPTQEQAVAALKAAYKKAIKEADLITVDIGINNFGVYASNQIVSNMYENDMNTIDPELAAIYAEGKAFVMEVLEEQAGDLLDFIPVDVLDHMADTMAYALVGFCLSFDAVMEQIYTLNPDVNVAVVSIQNLMYGLYASMEGIEEPLPFGDIFGALVNAANVYTATVSPYCDKYVYADVRAKGHVEFFMDEMLTYNGDPATLSQDMKDCFDVYDNDLYIKTRVQQLLAKELLKNKYLDIGAAVAMGGDIENNLEHFAIAYQNGLLIVPIDNGITLEQFFAAGAAGQLPKEAQPYYDSYVVALNAAYDACAEMMQAGIAIDTLDASSFGQNFGPVEDVIFAVIFEGLLFAIENVMDDPSYEFDLDELFPEGFYEAIAEISPYDAGLVKTVAAMGIRTGIGNSFYGHPNGNGQKELADAIIAALKNKTTGKDVIKNEILIGLEPAIKYFEDLGIKLLGILEKNLKPVAEELEAELEILGGELEAKLATLDAKLADLTEKEEVILADMLAEREAIAAELEALEAELAGIYAEPVSANGITKKMSATTVADTAEELETELEAAIAETKAALAELDAKILEIKNRIETDKAGIEAIEAAIEVVKANIAETEAALAKVNAAIEKLVADLDALGINLETLTEASKLIGDFVNNNVDPEEVYEAVKAFLENLPETIETIEDLYDAAVVAVEDAKAAVAAIEESAEIIKTNVENLVESAKGLAAIEGEKVEAIKATAEEIYDLAEAFVIDNLPAVEDALKETADEIDTVIKEEIEKAKALWAEYDEVVMAALYVAYTYCEDKGYIKLAEDFVKEHIEIVETELEKLE